jgi:hypothetical protein
MPKTRIRGVAASADAGGTTVDLDLACDCRVSTAFVGARYLAIDVADRGAVPGEPSGGQSNERVGREVAAVATAEQLLIHQIERAAGQGLVRLSNSEPEEPEESDGVLQAVKNHPSRSVDLASISWLNGNEQIDAVTVFDWDDAYTGAPAGKTSSACIEDGPLDVAAWSTGMPFTRQLTDRRRRLVGEFDVPDPNGIADLARLYIHFGFGWEAAAVIAGFHGASVPDGSLLADLARIVEGSPAAEDGPLSTPVHCPGLHALWLALGGRAPVVQDAEQFTEVRRSFESLPAALRRQLAPRFVERLRAAGRPEESRIIFDIALRTGDAPTVEMRLEQARSIAEQGDTSVAAGSFSALAEGNDINATAALTELVRLALETGAPIPDRVVSDVRFAAMQYRRSVQAVGLRMLLIDILAARGELALALHEARAAVRDFPSEAAEIQARVVQRIAASDPSKVGRARYAEAVLSASDLIAGLPTRDPARRSVARALVGLGLPSLALGTLAPALIADDPAARLIAVDAYLAQASPVAALQMLGGTEGNAAAKLRARSYALEGNHNRAVVTLMDAGLPDEAARYAWVSGSWREAQDATDDPERLAMAVYMAARSDPTATLPRSPDPGTLEPVEAFREPVPPLDVPSLEAARRLTAAGGAVAALMKSVLGAE